MAAIKQAERINALFSLRLIKIITGREFFITFKMFGSERFFNAVFLLKPFAQIDEFVERLNTGAATATISSSPSILTLDGVQASLTVGEEMMINGEYRTIGQNLNVIPTISPDGSSIRVLVVAEWSRVNEIRD